MKKQIQVVAAFALALSSVSFAQQAVQWGGNGHWYQFSGCGSWGASTAQSCKAAANAVNAHLVTLTSAAEHDFVVQSFLQCGQAWVWLGAHRAPSGNWEWDSGETWEYSAIGASGCHFGTTALRMSDEGWYCGRWAWFMWPDDYAVVVHLLLEWDADCNGDGIVDFGQIKNGTLPDQNANNIPDRCECQQHPELVACCYGDLNADRRVDGSDLAIMLAFWGAVTTFPKADIDGNGQINGADLSLLLNDWGECPH